MSQKLLFFGNERLATGLTSDAPIFQSLIAAGYDIGAVIISQDTQGPSRKADGQAIASVAEQQNIPVIYSPKKLLDIKDELASFGADAAVLVSYGKIVPQEIIDIFPSGIINIHPSLLPKHRGPTPLESVILAGENMTGISIMALGAKMDAGPVYVQNNYPLNGSETKYDLANALRTLGKDMLLEYLPAILDGTLVGSPQNEDDATYDALITKESGLLDFTKNTAQLEREIRAFAIWPRSRTTLGSTDVIITSAHVTEGLDTPGKIWKEDKQLGIYTTDGILVIDELIPAGKKPMSAAAFLAGYKV